MASRGDAARARAAAQDRDNDLKHMTALVARLAVYTEPSVILAAVREGFRAAARLATADQLTPIIRAGAKPADKE